jgi:hypothetical protein
LFTPLILKAEIPPILPSKSKGPFSLAIGMDLLLNAKNNSNLLNKQEMK